MVVAVNNGELPAQVAGVAARRRYPFPVAVDADGAVLRAYGVTLRPTTVFVGPDGHVRAVRAGAHSLAQLHRQVLRLGLEDGPKILS